MNLGGLNSYSFPPHLGGGEEHVKMEYLFERGPVIQRDKLNLRGFVYSKLSSLMFFFLIVHRVGRLEGSAIHLEKIKNLYFLCKSE
jgi:hypothetical protein